MSIQSCIQASSKEGTPCWIDEWDSPRAVIEAVNKLQENWDTDWFDVSAHHDLEPGWSAVVIQGWNPDDFDSEPWQLVAYVPTESLEGESQE